MRHIWSVVCRYAIEDRHSNNFSLIETFSQVSFKGEIPPERPVNLPISYHIVSSWRRRSDQDDCDYPVRMRVIAPGDIQLDSDDLTARLSEHDNCKTFFRSDVFPYIENGIYEFEIAYKAESNWNIVARIPLQIVHEPPEPEQKESESAE